MKPLKEIMEEVPPGLTKAYSRAQELRKQKVLNDDELRFLFTVECQCRKLPKPVLIYLLSKQMGCYPPLGMRRQTKSWIAERLFHRDR